jgi:hypothetical protein
MVSGPGYWTGISVQFKYAYLYRDGSITFPSPASATIIKHLIKGQGIAGYQLNSVTIGPTIEGNEVVARLVYFASAGLANPNLSIPGNFPDGFEWPSPFLEPNWAGGSVGGIAILPDNATTTLANFQLGDLDRAFGSYTGAVCGRGNVPYDNGSGAVLSVDPIPIWPNPDGPFLEDVDPPNDIDDANEDLLHEDSGSQPFSMTTDLSQIRNKVMVIGSGSILTASGAIGDSAVYVADVAAFSPSGGTVKYDDPGTGAVVKIRYTGVQGVPGNAAITLASSLTQVIPQGTNIANYFEAEDHESQLFLSKIELDKDGHTTDGVHEYTIVDTSLKATFQLFMRAYAELELFSKPIVSIRYATRDPKSRSGQSVHVDLTSPPCVGDFLIQQVQIDQIHDESDQLLPRYTVTASSSKFDLNDLLLKIIGGDLNSHGGGSSAGIVAAGVAQSTAAATVGLPNPAMWPNGRKWTLVTYHVNGASDALSSGLSSGWNSSGSTANQNDVYPGTGGVMSNWVRYLPVNNNGNLCGIASSGGNFWEMHPKGIFRFRTGSKLNNMAAGGNHRAYWFGLFTAAPANGGVVTVTAPHVSLLCFDPGDGGGSFEISSTVSGTGSTQVRSNLGFAPMLPNTHYRVTVTSSDTSATILVEDLTRNLNYTASVNIAAYHSTEMIAATKNFLGVMYGSATIMSPEVTVGAGGLDIGAGYLEVD